MIRGEDNDNLAPQLRIEQSQSTYVIRIRNPHGRAFADSDRGAKPFLVGKLFLRFSHPFRKPRAKGLVAAQCPGNFPFLTGGGRF
jgi:hypothetical protein